MMNKNTNFTDMVHSILGESCLSRSIKTVMSESSLSRVQKWRTEHDTAAMATARFNKPKEQAKKEKYELQEWLRAHGYAYTKFDGYYQEQEMPQASREDSLLIVDINDKGNLKQLIQKLGAKYGQESVLFRPKGADSKSILIKTTPKGMGKETPQASGTDYGKRGGAAWSEIGGRPFGDKIDISGSFWSDEDEEEDYLTIVVGDLYEWLMEVGTNSLLDDFKPYQIKAVIEMLLKNEKNLPNDDTEMANWCRKNEDNIIETVARATGAYSMSREDFLKKQQEDEEEQEMPQVVVKGSEILYNKRGRACGIKIQVNDQGTVYMKRRGSNWEITDISQQSDDQRVWDVVKSSLEKMAKKNPTTFIRLMRNRAYELPKFKPTTIGESVTVNGIDVTVQDIQKRMSDADSKIISQWLDKNDGWDFNSFNEITLSVEDDTNPQQRLSNAINQISAIVHRWLNLTDNNTEVTTIIEKSLKDYVKQTKNIPTTKKTIRKFIDTIWADQLKPFKKEKVDEEQEENSVRYGKVVEAWDKDEIRQYVKEYVKKHWDEVPDKKDKQSACKFIFDKLEMNNWAYWENVPAESMREWKKAILDYVFWEQWEDKEREKQTESEKVWQPIRQTVQKYKNRIPKNVDDPIYWLIQRWEKLTGKSYDKLSTFAKLDLKQYFEIELKKQLK